MKMSSVSTHAYTVKGYRSSTRDTCWPSVFVIDISPSLFEHKAQFPIKILVSPEVDRTGITLETGIASA